jgi:endonuclease III
MIEVNRRKCEDIGNIVKNLRFRLSFFKRELLTFDIEKELKAMVYFYATAICHQTRELQSKNKKLVGWDYLTSVFIDLAKTNPDFLRPENLGSMNEIELSIKLKTIFSDDNNPEHTTLSRSEERARFLINCANVLRKKFNSSVLKLLEKSDGYLINGNTGLYHILEEFEAYTDPLKKKSGVLVHFLVSSGLLEIKDTQNILPIVDYHVQRVFLRMGCIEVDDNKLREKLKGFEKIESDEDFRTAVQEVFRIISRISGKSILELDDIFWSLGRSCCQAKTTLCRDKVCGRIPCTFNDFMNLPNHSNCIFEKNCKGSADSEYRELLEPNVDTHYY